MTYRRLPRTTLLTAPLLLLAACGADPAPDLALSFQDQTLSPSAPEAAFPGLIGVINADDDALDGVIDWDAGIPHPESGQAATYDPLDSELVEVVVHASDRPLRLSLEGDPLTVRVWRNGEVLLGDDGAAGITEVVLGHGLRDVSLWVEFGDYNARHALTVAEEPGEEDAGGDEDRRPLATLRLPLSSAPLVLNHHLQPAERMWAMQVPSSWGPTYNNAAMIEAFEAQLGDRFVPIAAGTYQGDVWVQDEFEFSILGHLQGQLDLVVDSIRNGQGASGHGLDDVPEDLIAVEPDWAVDTWGVGTRATTYDSFGNLEATPPVTVDGVFYPFGRIYYGSVGRMSPNEELRLFLDDQQVQRPFTLDTSWLIVGHVDEFVSFIPDPSSERGFKLVIADTDAAWAVLDTLDPDAPLTRWDGSERRYEGHDMATIGELVDHPGLRDLNEDLQRDVLDPQLELLLAETGLTEADVIRLPSLFYEPWGASYGAVALLPGMVNLTVWNPEGETPTLFLADPYLRGEGEPQSADPMIAAVRALLPEGVDSVFVDNWYVYHMGLGEVHCGTNVERQVLAQWWTDALHLVEE